MNFKEDNMVTLWIFTESSLEKSGDKIWKKLSENVKNGLWNTKNNLLAFQIHVQCCLYSNKGISYVSDTAREVLPDSEIMFYHE